MVEIYFIRHGESVGNKADRFRGRFDFQLNQNGIRQAEALRDKLRPIKFDRIFSSPLSRALKTAGILADGNCEIEINEGFTNISLGDWENTPKQEVAKKYPELWQLWKTNPEKLDFEGLETLAQVRHRSYQALLNVVERSETLNRIAVVSHRAVLKPLFAAILNMNEPYFWKIQLDTASFSIAEYRRETGFTFTLINEHYHLDDFIREDLG